MSDKQTNELLPCPFCGKPPFRLKGVGSEDYVVCETELCAIEKSYISTSEAWNRRASLANAQGEAVAWIRFCSDGCYEGPIMDCAMEDVRKKSGAWTPLYANPPMPDSLPDEPPPLSQEPMVVRDLRDGMSLHDNPNLIRKDGEQIIAYIDALRAHMGRK